MNGEININWKGKQIDYNPHVFYEEFASDDKPLISMGELQEINDYIQETYAECEAYVQEGSIIKNAVRRFGALIKKIISTIVRVLGFIGKQIGRLFSWRPKLDVDSVCRKLKFKIMRDGKFKIEDSYSMDDPLFKYTKIENNEMSIDVGKIFKKSSNSHKMPTTIKTVMNQVIYKVDNGFNIKISKDDLGVPIGWKAQRDNPNPKREQLNAGKSATFVLLAHMEYPDILANIGAVFEPVLRALTSGGNIDANRCDKYIKQINDVYSKGADKILKYGQRIQGSEQFVDGSDIREFQKNVSSVSDVFIKFQDANFDINEALKDSQKERLIKLAQQVLEDIETLQMGINALVVAANKPNKFISGKYIGCCDNLVLLDSFVKELIKAGVPSAHIGLNTYLVASPKIRGSFDADWEPKWGQSRLTLYPSDKSNVCYKIALNGMGTRSNNTEYSYYKSKPDLQGILAGVKDIGANKCVLVVERLQENKQVSYMKMAEFQSTHKDLIDKYHLGDIHQNNVAYDMNNNIKIIDFGWVNMPSYT